MRPVLCGGPYSFNGVQAVGENVKWAGSQRAASEADQAWQKLQASIHAKKMARLKAEQEAKAARKPKRRKKKRLTYAEYINSKRWAAKRQEAFAFHGNRCSECGASHRLQVHHIHYKTLFNERMQDLRILCHDCHANHHEGDKPGVMDPMTRAYLAIEL